MRFIIKFFIHINLDVVIRFYDTYILALCIIQPNIHSVTISAIIFTYYFNSIIYLLILF